MKIIPYVTARDIREGIKQDCERCPLALAINRAMPLGFGKVSIGPDFVDIYSTGPDGNGQPVASIPLPPRAVQWRQRFDDNRGVEPITFTLEVDLPGEAVSA
ncbi:MAG TPA: hypothetical protein VK474_11625 [Chthoniobacterales bacterium]|nr:hypothetical protein [Chthoniobacterales bacterium]